MIGNKLSSLNVQIDWLYHANHFILIFTCTYLLFNSMKTILKTFKHF